MPCAEMERPAPTLLRGDTVERKDKAGTGHVAAAQRRASTFLILMGWCPKHTVIFIAYPTSDRVSQHAQRL